MCQNAGFNGPFGDCQIGASGHYSRVHSMRRRQFWWPLNGQSAIYGCR